MADTNISKATKSNMTDRVDDYEVGARQTDSATGQKETAWMNTKATTYFGYYKSIPELKSAVDALATWIVGKGYTAENIMTEAILDNIIGWGEDTFNSIMWNLLVQKKVYGDCFAEIIRNEKTGTLTNLKPLDPAKIKIIVDSNGMIRRYEQHSQIGEKKLVTKFEPHEILHMCNSRVADEIHGVSIIESVQWVIDAKNEAMEDQRKLLHRNVKPIIMFKVDEDNQSKLDAFIEKMDKCVAKGENIYVPKGNVEFEIVSVPSNATLNPNPWIQYLDNTFYRTVGVPKVILGGSEEFTEASSKVGYLTFEQVYNREQTELQADLWNQCAIKIKLNKPASLRNEMLSSEEKNTGQVGFQPKETTATMEKE